jgi:hypothetical protein
MNNNEMFVSLTWAVVLLLCVFNITLAVKSIVLGMYENWQQRDERFEHERKINDRNRKTP